MDGQGRPGLARGVKDKWEDPAAFMVVGPLPSSIFDSLRRTLALKRVTQRDLDHELDGRSRACPVQVRLL